MGRLLDSNLLGLGAHRDMSDHLDGQGLLLRIVNLARCEAHLSQLVEWAARASHPPNDSRHRVALR
jgi:hypothetical protein